MGFVELLPADAHRTVEWYGRRREGITASEVAAVLELSPYESAWSLWHRKVGMLSADSGDNDAMLWGRRLEALIVDEFHERHPEFSVADIGLVASKERPWQLATPDAVAFEHVADSEDGPADPVAGVEAKTTDSWDGWGDEGSDDIPVVYRCQTLWQADVLGVGTVFVPVLSRGKDYREYVVAMDDDARADLKIMRERALGFLASVEAGEPPPLDSHSATTQALRLLHPDVEDVDVTVTAGLAEAYREARAGHESSGEALQLATNRLLEAVGGGRRAVDPDGNKIATRIVSERSSLDVKGLAADYPQIVGAYRRSTTVAQLRAAPKPKEKGKIK